MGGYSEEKSHLNLILSWTMGGVGVTNYERRDPTEVEVEDKRAVNLQGQEAESLWHTFKGRLAMWSMPGSRS